jgi:hypothetical protein
MPSYQQAKIVSLRRGVHLIGVYLTGVHLMSVHLIGVHLMSVYLIASIS